MYIYIYIYIYIYSLNTCLTMNVAYLKVTFFYSAPDCWCLFTGIVVHQLWSSAFSCKHEEWAWGAWSREWRVTFKKKKFLATAMVPSRDLVPYTNNILCILVSSMSYRPYRKGTLASDLKALLVTPKFCLMTMGSRAFRVVAPRLWNALPQYIRQASSLLSFKNLLKTNFFSEYYFSS